MFGKNSAFALICKFPDRVQSTKSKLDFNKMCEAPERVVAGLRVSVHHMFQNSNFAQFASKDLPQQYFNDETPTNENTEKLSRNHPRSVESEIFRAKEFTSCPTSLLQYENIDRVLVIFNIASNCGKASMRIAEFQRVKQWRRRQKQRTRKVFDFGFTLGF